MSREKLLIAGNWKMNHGPDQTRIFFENLIGLFSSINAEYLMKLLTQGQLEITVIPPHLSLATAVASAKKIRSFKMHIASQNAHGEKKGAFTGEISAQMLREIGVHTVLVGHSERRHVFGETDELVRKRLDGLITQDMQVILCVGETLEERKAGKTFSILERQLSSALLGLKLSHKITIAYEPVWAIGTGLTATPIQAKEAHQMIKDFLKTQMDAAFVTDYPIIYGGSVTPENIESLVESPSVDGVLVGGASLDAGSFFQLIQNGSRVLKVKPNLGS